MIFDDSYQFNLNGLFDNKAAEELEDKLKIVHEHEVRTTKRAKIIHDIVVPIAHEENDKNRAMYFVLAVMTVFGIVLVERSDLV